mgnify:CR=1
MSWRPTAATSPSRLEVVLQTGVCRGGGGGHGGGGERGA